ncbi:MAG TPA: alanine acetyltransferase, partial [Pseudoalteromonas sp.]|nr:alanine acetyltransferase [Pseudoalteromonas sp.]
MKLKGACHCGKVTFSVSSKHPYPYNLCYCSICRKTAGSGGFVINLSAQYSTLEVTGREHITVYHAKVGDKTSPAERHFCKHCSSNLWLYDSRWPEQVHPFAG